MGSTTINWGASLNYGLVGWWRVHPNTFGRPVWQDFVGKNDATLTNGASFRGSSHVGGHGAIAYDGTNDYCVLPTNPVGIPAIDGAKSVGFWVTTDGTSTRRLLIAFVKDDTSSANNSVSLDVDVAASNPAIRANKWGATSLGYAATGFANNQWFHVIYTYTGSGTGHKFYINGRDATAGTGAAGNSGATGIIRFGSLNSAFPTPYHNRQLDDIRIYNRTLSSTEALGLYHESLAGYPNLLVRRRRTIALNAAAASGIVGPLVGGRLIGGPLVGGRLAP
jgi:hypothetical protein